MKKLDLIEKISNSHFLQPNEKCVMTAIALISNQQKQCTITLFELGEKTNFHYQSLWRLITKLVKKGCIKRFGSKTDERINTYEILM